MKNLARIILIFLFVQIALTINAQNCTTFLPMNNGAIYEYKILRGKGHNPAGKYEYKIASVDGNKAQLEVQQFRENGNTIEKPAKYTIICEAENTLIVPDSTNWPAMSMGRMTLSNDMKQGQTLSSVTTNFYTVKNPNKVFGKIEVYNFAVKQKESITVASMTLDAFLVEYDMFGGPGLFPPKAHVKEWYAIGQGLVRSERYGPDGSQLYFTVEFAGEKKR